MKRMALNDLYKLCWLIDCQYDPESAFIANGEWSTLQDGAVHSDYHIDVSGSSDGWNRAQKQQTMINLFQMLKGDPYIDQMNLHRKMLEVMTPDSVRKLLTSPQMAQADAGNQQAMETAVMDVTNYPWPVKPSDNHGAHIQNIVQFVESTQTPGNENELNGRLAKQLTTHAGQHYEYWSKQDKQAATEAQPQMQQALAILQHIIQQDQQGAGQQQIPQGSPNGPLTAGAPTPAAIGAGGAPGEAGAPSEPSADALNALANAHKAGLPVTIADYAAALEKAGLPPYDPTSPLVAAIMPNPKAAPAPKPPGAPNGRQVTPQ
jgi:hypothetical protein